MSGGKVTLYYEGQEGKLALRCGIRLVWMDPKNVERLVILHGIRWSDSPHEAQVSLLELLGQRFINVSKEAERHEKRSLELEAQLGDALHTTEIFRDENQEFKDVLLEKDERILDLEGQISNLRTTMESSSQEWQLLGETRVEALVDADGRVKELERQLASAIAQGQEEREAKYRARQELAEQIEVTRMLQVQKRELEEQVANRDRLIEEANAYTKNQVIELAALRARNAELERLPARNERLEEDMAVARRDQELLTQQLEKVVALAKVVIDSSKRME